MPSRQAVAVACALLALAAVAPAQGACPVTAWTATDGSCSCVTGSSCAGSQCNAEFTGFPSSCSDCKCELDPLVHAVTFPTHGSELVVGGNYTITWDHSAAVSTVDIKLFEAESFAGNDPVLKLVDTLATGIENTGSFRWMVPRDLPPVRNHYSVIVFDGGSAGASFSNTPLFSVVDVPEGPCRAGTVSSSGINPGCERCARGTYAAGSTTCTACPRGKTTPGLGAAGATECSVHVESSLAQFQLVLGGMAMDSSYKVLNEMTLEACAVACDLDASCQSFDFNSGECQLSYDTVATALPHSLPLNSKVQLYQRVQPDSAAALEPFTRVENAFIRYQSATLAQPVAQRSLTACAFACLRDSKCFSFLQGHGARVGQCVLLTKAVTGTADPSIVSGHGAEVLQLDLYFRTNTTATACPAGQTSPTGQAPCTPCPYATYSATSPFMCTPCGFGKTTTMQGAATADACYTAICPPGSNGPSSQQTCDCTTSCTEPDDSFQCSGKSFPTTCRGCTCAEAPPEALILQVTDPKAKQQVYIGEPVTLAYTATSTVRAVLLAYYFQVSEPPGYKLYLLHSANVPISPTGRHTFIMPEVPETDTARFFVYNYFNWNVYKHSSQFSVKKRPTGDCPAGMFNKDSGEQPCQHCAIGSYSNASKSTSCTACPTGKKTFDYGSKSIDDCTIGAESPLSQFEKVPHHYLEGSNAAGYFIEDHEAVDAEGCARLCLNDPACLSFDAGRLDEHQAFDCFMSYDSKDTIPDKFKEVSQLDYYQRISPPDLSLDTMYKRETGCFINGHDNAGVYEQTFSPVTCAQLCANDDCCRSFEVGVGSRQYDCFLSYEDHTTVGPADFVCDTRFQLDYLQKLAIVEVVFIGSSYQNTLSTTRQVRDFTTLLKQSVTRAVLQTTVGFDDVVLSPTADGSIMARLVLDDIGALPAVEAAVNDGLVSFVFPQIIGSAYTAKFSQTHGVGPCEPGTVSVTGRHPGCQTCPRDTHSNKAGTKCQQCPDGTFAEPGTASASECKPKGLETISAYHPGDEWVGSFSINDPLASGHDGGLSIQVMPLEQGDESKRSLLFSFSHGKICYESSRCFVSGLSQQFVSGTVDGASINAAFSSWAAITDQSFYRISSVTASISVSSDSNNGTNAVLSGSFKFVIGGKTGSTGTFRAVRRCQAKEEFGAFAPGDKWLGIYTCKKEVNGQVTQEKEVKRIELFVTSVSETGRIEAVVDLDIGDSAGEYLVAGQAADHCSMLSFAPQKNAWLSNRPADAVARQLVGSLSEDGEWLSGQFETNPNCACIGLSAPHHSNPAVGASCDKFGLEQPWCYVDPSCPEAVPSTQSPGWQYALCSQPSTCEDFQLARICPEAPPMCQSGWSLFNLRCYRFHGAVRNFESAEALCGNDDAHVVSIHSDAESSFVSNLTDGVAVWLALVAENNSATFDWLDASASLYEDWALDEPQGTGPLCSIVTDQGWRTDSCSSIYSVVCKKGTVGVNASCACTGETDGSGKGGDCEAWEGSSSSQGWCYVSQYCSRAVYDTDMKKWHASCALPETTIQPTTTTPQNCHANDPKTYSNNGVCTPCTIASDCESNEYLSGTCGTSSTPMCLPCDPTCATCSSVGSNKCTSCPAGRVFLQAQSACYEACPSGFFNQSGVCTVCHASCKSCSGAGANKCTSCATGGDLFLSPAGSCTNSCQSFGDYFKNKDTQRCAACAPCGKEYFQNAPCTEDTDFKCSVATVCKTGQYERVPLTPTSNRECAPFSTCAAGTFISFPGNATMDRVCTPCPAGTIDDDFSPTSECKACPKGTYVAAGLAGSCNDHLCPLGHFDHDDDSSTKCRECPVETFSNQKGAFSQCTNTTKCRAGEEQARPPSTIADRVCAPCLQDSTFSPQPGAPCQPVQTCKAGFTQETAPTTSSDRKCMQCEDGFHKPSEGNGKCIKNTNCLPGFEEDSAPSTTSDRTCKACTLGETFNNVTGGKCRAVSSCDGVAQFQLRPATTTADVKCASVTICSQNQFVKTRPTNVSNAVCAPLSAPCNPPVTYEEVSPQQEAVAGAIQFVTDRTCVKCRACTLLLQNCTLTQDAQCDSCETCGSNQYQAVPCDTPVGPGQQRCVACSACEIGVTFQVSPCTSQADRNCTSVSPCSFDDGFYVATPATLTRDLVCKPISECGPGEQERAEPTPNSDRRCEPCIKGETFRNETMSKCEQITRCPPGQRVVTPATTSSDQVCAPCPLSTFEQDGTCVVVSNPCSAGFAEVVRPSPTSDRVCAPCNGVTEFQDKDDQTSCKEVTICQAGQEEVIAPSPTRNRKCQTCAQGFFQDKANQTSCKPVTECGTGLEEDQDPTPYRDRTCRACEPGVSWKSSDLSSVFCQSTTECAAGFFESKPANATADRVCSPCPTDTFKSGPGQSSDCKPVTQCPAGYEETAFPSSTQDRTCTLCSENFFKSSVGQTSCVAVRSICPAGSYQMKAPTASSDRVCEPCPPNLFSDFAGAPQCRTPDDCLPGTFVEAKPTSSSNRKCTACNGVTEFSLVRNAEKCETVTTCPADKETAKEPSLVNDRECQCIQDSPTQRGTYQPGTYDPTKPCQQVSKCNAGLVTFNAATRQSDKTCADPNKIGLLQAVIPADFNTVLPTRAAEFSFEQVIAATVKAIQGIPTSLLVRVDVSPGSIVATIELSDKEYVPMVEDQIAAGLFSFLWQQKTYTASFTDQYGPCLSETFSGNGQKPCKQATTCGADQEQVAAPTRSSDRVCQAVSRSSSGGSSNLPLILGVIGAGIVILLAVLILVLLRRKRTMKAGVTSPRSFMTAPAHLGGAEFTNPLYSDTPSTSNSKNQSRADSPSNDPGYSDLSFVNHGDTYDNVGADFDTGEYMDPAPPPMYGDHTYDKATAKINPVFENEAYDSATNPTFDDHTYDTASAGYMEVQHSGSQYLEVGSDDDI